MGLGAALVALVAWLILGPVQQPAATATPIEERTYAVKPASLNVKAGIVTGELTELKVTEARREGVRPDRHRGEAHRDASD